MTLASADTGRLVDFGVAAAALTSMFYVRLASFPSLHTTIAFLTVEKRDREWRGSEVGDTYTVLRTVMV